MSNTRRSPIILTIDIGTFNSGFCLFDINERVPVEHGCITSKNTEEMIRDLFSIAKRRKIAFVAIELNNSRSSSIVKLRRLIDTMELETGIKTVRCSAPEWRHSLHMHSKKKDREEYKHLALAYVKEHFPTDYYEGISDDEAEAICMGDAYALGVCSFVTNKERKNEAAKAKKQYFKHEEPDEYEEEYKQFLRY